MENYPNLAQFLAMYKEQIPIPARRRLGAHINSNGSAKIDKRSQSLDVLARQEVITHELMRLEEEAKNLKAKSDFTVLNSPGISKGYFDNSKLFDSDAETSDSNQPTLALTEIVGKDPDTTADVTLTVEELDNPKESSLCKPEETVMTVDQNMLHVQDADQQKSQKSFRTARSGSDDDDRTEMYSAIDEMDDVDDDIDEDDDDNQPYYDTFNKEQKLSRTRSESEMAEELEETGMADVSARTHVSDKDFDAPDARISNSLPSLSNVAENNTDSITSMDVVESKPELNYAFISESMQSTQVDDDNENLDDEGAREISHMLLGVDSDTSTTRIDVVVEDTDTHDKVTLSMHAMSCTTAAVQSVSSVTSQLGPCARLEQFREEDLRMTIDYLPPSCRAPVLAFGRIPAV